MAEQLGYMNFNALSSYNWTKEDFTVNQNYIKKELRQYILSSHSYGILFGCKISVVAGFTISISEGLVIFSNGELVSVPALQIDVGASDPAQVRFDRLCLNYTVVDGQTVYNVANQPQILDKQKVGASNLVAGALGGAAPALPAGQISLGVIRVQAAAVALTSADLDQSHKYRNLSQDIRKHDRSYDVPNAIAVNTDFHDLYFDGAILSAVRIKYFCHRKDENQSKKSFGILTFINDEDSGDWRGEGESSPDVTGLNLGIDVSGQVHFQTSAFSATDYSGKLTILDIDYIYRE